MKFQPLIPILTATLTTVVATSASAATFTFDGSDNGSNPIVKTVDGITITLSNFDVTDGTPQVDGDGIFLDETPNQFDSSSFDISFDSTIEFDSYEIGFINPGVVGTFSLSNPNGADSTGNPLNPVGTFSFNNPFILSAGQTATFNVTSLTGATPLSQLRTITVNPAQDPQPTPEPSTLISLGLLSLGAFAAKRKAS